jgi:hypothetical protein
MPANEYSFVTVWKIEAPWDVKTTQKFMSFLAFLLKPLLAWNHDEIMRWGALGLANKLKAKLIQGGSR